MATAGNTYFVRSLLLHQEGGLYITRKILEREIEHQKGESSLTSLLKDCESKLKHQYHGKQYKKLFPEYGDPDIYKWDLQLSVGVLLHVFRSTLTLTERQKLSALKELRNEIYMHCASPSLTLKQYENVREELEDILTSLAATFDVHVKQRCTSLISQFATGPLDGVKPSLATLNGFSQGCHKTFKVCVETELVVVAPSEHWTNLCESILDTILNNADSVESEGAGFEEIQRNVKKMLAFLQANKDVVFKGSKRECVALFFECNSYDDFLQFIEMFDTQELQVHLDRISEALLRYFKLSSPVYISCKVRTESLQLALINVIKMGKFEEEIVNTRIEMSSKEVIGETEGLQRHLPGSDDELCNTIESKQPLRIELKCTSREGLLHTLSSFKNEDFSDHLTSVADALSRHVGHKITLKASLNVQDVMEAIEESDHITTSVDDALPGHVGKKIALKSSNVQDDMEAKKESAESEIIDLNYRLVGMYPIFKEELYVEKIADHLHYRGFLSLSEFKDVRSQRRRRGMVIAMLQKVLNGPKKMQREFLTALRLYGYKHLAEVVKSSTISNEDFVVDIEMLCLRLRLVEQCSFWRDKFNVQRIAVQLLYRGFLSFDELEDVQSQRTSNKTLDKLLEKVVEGSMEMKREFMNALRQRYGHVPDDVENLIVSDTDLFDDTNLREGFVMQNPFIKEKSYVVTTTEHLHDRVLLSDSNVKDVLPQRTSNKTLDMFLNKGKGMMPINEGKTRLSNEKFWHGPMMKVTGHLDAPLTAQFSHRAILSLVVRVVKQYPFLKEELYVEDIADHLQLLGFVPFYELKAVRSQLKRSKRVDMFLQKVLKEPVGMLEEFMRVLRKYEAGYVAQVLEKTKIREEDLMIFAELKLSCERKCSRPGSDKPRIQFSDASRKILTEKLSRNEIENISDHLLSRLLFSITEHTDILFSKSKTQTVFIETLSKCSVDAYEDFFELLNQYSSKHLVDELKKHCQSELKMTEKSATAKGSTTKQDERTHQDTGFGLSHCLLM